MSTDEREFSVDSMREALDALAAMNERPLDVSRLVALPAWARNVPPTHTAVDDGEAVRQMYPRNVRVVE